MAENHLVIPDTVQAQYHMSVAGRSITVVTHMVVPVAATVTVNQANALFDAVKALWSANLAAFASPETGFNLAALKDLRTVGLPFVVSTNPIAVGTAPAGEALPRQVAAVLTIRTARAGKSYRGRMYWGGFAENANDSTQHMTAAAKTAIDAFCTGFINAVNINGWQLGVAHRPTTFDPDTGLPTAPGLGFTTPATQVLCRDNVWDTQRRRAS